MFLITASSLFIFQTSRRSQCRESRPSEVGQLDYYITLFPSCQVLFLLFLKKFFRTRFSVSLSRSDLLSISPFSPFVNTFLHEISHKSEPFFALIFDTLVSFCTNSKSLKHFPMKKAAFLSKTAFFHYYIMPLLPRLEKLLPKQVSRCMRHKHQYCYTEPYRFRQEPAYR